MHYTKGSLSNLTNVSPEMNVTCVFTEGRNQLKNGMPCTYGEDFIDPASVGHVSLVIFPVIVMDLH